MLVVGLSADLVSKHVVFSVLSDRVLKVRLIAAPDDAATRRRDGGSRPWLGVTVMPEAEGVRVDTILPGSPLESTDVRPGDILLKIDDRQMLFPEDVFAAVEDCAPGDEVAITLRGRRTTEVWPGVLRLSLHLNPGGPFSILRGHTYWLIGISVVALGVILYLYVTIVASGGRIGLISLAMISGGALGNLVDRLRLERVRDFIDVYIIHYPVFNVADSLITVGAALLVLELLRKERPKAAANAKDTTPAS